MANNLPLNKFVKISLLSTSRGAKQVNLSDVIMFTPLQYENGDTYRAYRSPDDVANDFGTESEPYKQAVSIFAQTPNILNNSGTLYIAPLLNGVLNPGKAGYYVTDVINAGAFAEITDGAFDIAIDGEAAVNVTGLDFTRSYTTTDIIGVLNAYFVENELGVTATEDAGKIVITSATEGATSSVELSTPATGTNLLSSLYFNETNCVAVQGIDATTGQETLVNAIIRLKAKIYFHGIIVAYSPAEDSEYLDASNYVQTIEKMLFITKHDLNVVEEGELFDIVKNRTNTHTRCFAYFADSDEASRVALAGYVGRGLSVNFSGSRTTISMHGKELYGVDPDPGIDLTLADKAFAVGADYYANFEGVPAVFCSGVNDFFDNVYNDNWLVTALQVAGFNALRQSGTKIPQTEDGVALLVDAYRNVLKQGVQNLAIAPGTWTREVTFGDQELFRTNIETFGYYIYSTPLAQQSQADRELRKAPYIQMAVKRAGAIHSSDVVVYINN